MAGTPCVFICMYDMGLAGSSEATVFRGFQIHTNYIFENSPEFSMETNCEEKAIPLRDIQRNSKVQGNPEVLTGTQRFSDKSRGSQGNPEVSREIQRLSTYYFQMFRGFHRDPEDLRETQRNHFSKEIACLVYCVSLCLHRLGVHANPG